MHRNIAGTEGGKKVILRRWSLPITRLLGSLQIIRIPPVLHHSTHQS